MLDIVGGTYIEVCDEPIWNQLFGSGLRAAAALSSLTKGSRLHTYIDRGHRDHLKAVANTFSITYEAGESYSPVSFYYTHGLATPQISPPPYAVRQAAPLAVHGKAVLRFGMIEGDAVVHGDRVVYDPQSPHNPKPFSENGSKARELAIVCNRREAQVMTQRTNDQAVIRSLLAESGAAVVLVKQGSAGVVVATRGRSVVVPALRTDHVWPIGSGDVFSSVFAHYWAEKRIDAITAARKASMAAACYCNSKVMPVPNDFERLVRWSFAPVVPRGHGSRPLVYLAGPFFTMAERWLITQARASLVGQGLRVFSPWHDVGCGAAADVAPADIKALRRSAVVLAIVDGVDAGTVFEIGFARALNIPVVVFVQNEHSGTLKMFDGTGCEICNEFVTAVYRTAWAAC